MISNKSTKCDQVGNNHNTQKCVVVKFGGSALTKKDQFETLNQVLLAETSRHIKEAIDQSVSIVLIHGAGSYGHFQANQYQLRTGGTSDGWLEGLAKTRESVLKLNGLVMQSLIKEKITAVALSLFPGTELDSQKQVKSSSKSVLENVAQLVQFGFLPVIHGDVLLMEKQKCAVFSGDRIMRWLCSNKSGLQVTSVVFLTDVDGVYDRPPFLSSSNDQPKLIEEIFVNRDGKIRIPISTDIAAHDVTGGMEAKIQTAVDIVLETGLDVFIVRAGSEDARIALCGRKPTRCTRICLDDKINK